MGEFAEYVEGHRVLREAERRSRRARRRELLDALDGLAAICRAHGADRVLLFGSLARDHPTWNPDIDLAVTGVPPARFFDLHGELLLEAPAPVDLVDLEDAPSRLRERILEEGVDL